MGANQLLHGIAGAETEHSLVASKLDDEHTNPYGEQSSAGVFWCSKTHPPRVDCTHSSLSVILI
jgi:hypothetical protein